MFDYKKIIVIGCPGSGKSTFSRKLHNVTQIELFHLDALYWNKDCTHITREELAAKQKEIFKLDSYIIDGNFNATLELRLKEADVVFLLDLPTDICVNGAESRKSNRSDMPCELPANDELIDFIKNFNADIMPIMKDLLKKYNSNVITFHSHKEADEYIENLKTVTVTIDRPLGSFHPNHKDLFYPVNYGFVDGIIAADGEEQDVYILGVNEPLKEFTGEFVAIIHRLNDVEDKWVVAPKGMKFTAAEIEKQVNFQEKYFEYTVEMIG